MSDVDRQRSQDQLDVSRETLDALTTYESLLHKWNGSINLVSKATLEDIWQRHFLDSIQVFDNAKPTKGKWLDLGSGGGFPGIVIAILAKERAPNLTVTCVESDIRKCEFMRTVCRETGTVASILSRRIEETPPQCAEYISARALAPLSKLLSFVDKHTAPEGVAFLLKGERYDEEIQSALASWSFSFEKYPSRTQKGSVILKIGELSRA